MRPADSDGFDALFRSEYSSILRTASLIVGDRAVAEELTQEAFIRLHTHWRKVSAYEAPGAWVRRVVIRLASRSRRNVRPSGRAPAPVAPGSEPEKLDVRRAVLSLPNAQRAAIVLHYFEDRPVAELAALLGCSESTAKVHLHRGRKRLGQILGEEAADVVG